MKRIILDKKYWILPFLAWTAVIASSWLWNRSEMDNHVRELVTSQGRFVFRMIEATRLWNAQHGGVYVPVTATVQPNPYLDVPHRDVTTTDGKALTLINPAYMTRQLGKVISEQMQMSARLTSLKPLNPINTPDIWERASLERFEHGEKEHLEFLPVVGNGTQVRYIAPLLTQQPCLKCHEKQGYKTGDIRGAISIGFDAQPFLNSVSEQQHNLLLIHLAVWLLLSGLSWFALTNFRQQMLTLQHAKEQQDALVNIRTAELRKEIGERRQAEEEMRLLMDSSGEGIYGVDFDGNCTFCNPVALQLLGMQSAEQLLGKNMNEIVYRCQQATDEGDSREIKLNLYRQGQAVHDEDEFCRADGSPIPVEYRCHPIEVEEQVIGAVVTFSDITERKRTQEQIWHRANFDSLTSLPNRNLFHDRLNQAIIRADRRSAPLALLFIDLDGFKAVNDNFGHAAGDKLLVEVARRLVACVRDSDTVARLAGDEFTLILPDVGNIDEAGSVAEKILSALTQSYLLDEQEAHVTASIGIALYPGDGENATVLLRHADEAMYHVKEKGRNHYLRYQRPT